MKILYQHPKKLPRRRALIGRSAGWFDGWTGYEYFGCLVPHRYFGWQLHCWANVYVEAFGDIRQAIFFARIGDATDVINRLMDFADKRGHLAHEPVAPAQRAIVAHRIYTIEFRSKLAYVAFNIFHRGI